jgi:hypothetical protein
LILMFVSRPSEIPVVMHSSEISVFFSVLMVKTSAGALLTGGGGEMKLFNCLSVVFSSFG